MGGSPEDPGRIPGRPEVPGGSREGPERVPGDPRRVPGGPGERLGAHFLQRLAGNRPHSFMCFVITAFHKQTSLIKEVCFRYVCCSRPGSLELFIVPLQVAQRRNAADGGELLPRSVVLFFKAGLCRRSPLNFSFPYHPTIKHIKRDIKKRNGTNNHPRVFGIM